MQAQNEFMQNVERFKETDFYKNFVSKIYACLEQSDIIYFEPKVSYSSKDIKNCYAELGDRFEYIIADSALLDEDAEGNPIIHLVEVR